MCHHIVLLQLHGLASTNSLETKANYRDRHTHTHTHKHIYILCIYTYVYLYIHIYIYIYKNVFVGICSSVGTGSAMSLEQCCDARKRGENRFKSWTDTMQHGDGKVKN